MLWVLKRKKSKHMSKQMIKCTYDMHSLGLITEIHFRHHYQMGCVTTKPVFGVSNKVIIKLACSATESSRNIEIWHVECLDIILSVNRTTKALIRLAGLRLCCSQPPEDRFCRVEAQIMLLL